MVRIAPPAPAMLPTLSGAGFGGSNVRRNLWGASVAGIGASGIVYAEFACTSISLRGCACPESLRLLRTRRPAVGADTWKRTRSPGFRPVPDTGMNPRVFGSRFKTEYVRDAAG